MPLFKQCKSSLNSINSISSVNNVNSVNSVQAVYGAVLPPFLTVFSKGPIPSLLADESKQKT